MKPQPRCVWDAGAILGEGPLWVEREQALYWVDIKSSQLHRLHPGDGERTSWPMPPAISAIVSAGDHTLLAAFADGLKLVDTRSGSVQALLDPEPQLPGNRLNDGACDRAGNFWFGSMDDGETQPSGAFYRYTPDRRCIKVESGMVITNGPAFSPDGRTIYLTDTLEKTIFRADLHDDGSLSGRRVFARIASGEGYPDGMTTDAEGSLWCAHFGGARITRFDPSGRIGQRVELPVPNVTKCCFGGPELRTLYITTAAKGLSKTQLQEFPLSGGLFAVELDVAGWASPEFALIHEHAGASHGQ